MKQLWALSLALRIGVAHALERPFSVQNDLLAFPQYEIIFSESYIPASEAEARLELASRPKEERTTPDQKKELAKSLLVEQRVLDDAFGDDDNDRYEHMILNGTEFLCRIPHVSPENQVSPNASTASQSEQQQELVRASDHGWELLSAMQGNCLYFGGGWWVYSFCYGEDIRQFHPLAPGRGVPNYPPTPDPSVYNFVLGRFKSNGPQSKEVARGERGGEGIGNTELSSELQTRGETNFLVQKLGGGTVCDLTGEDRQVEIQYHCNPTSPDRISLIKETASCVYLLIIHTPRLCNDVAFQPPQLDRPNPITCQEIVAKKDEVAWRAIKAAKAKYDLSGGQDAETTEPASKHIVIGGIEVGAQKLVGGTPERTIKASNIAKPRKVEDKEERFIVTLAESDGKKLTVLNEREIQKYDLKNTLEDIDEFIIEAEAWAEKYREGQPWRLDVVQTAEGLQFRGILIQDEDEEEEAETPPAKTPETEKAKAKAKGSKEKTAAQEGSKEEYKQRKAPPQQPIGGLGAP